MYSLWWVTIGLFLITSGLVFFAIKATRVYNEAYYNNSKEIFAMIFSWMGVVVTSITTILLIISSILNPIDAKYKYYEFMNTREIVAEISPSFDIIDKFGIGEKIIDMDMWLANAKADKEVWGSLSMYYAIDLDSLEPIVLVKE